MQPPPLSHPPSPPLHTPGSGEAPRMDQHRAGGAATITRTPHLARAVPGGTGRGSGMGDTPTPRGQRCGQGLPARGGHKFGAPLCSPGPEPAPLRSAPGRSRLPRRLPAPPGRGAVKRSGGASGAGRRSGGSGRYGTGSGGTGWGWGVPGGGREGVPPREFQHRSPRSSPEVSAQVRPGTGRERGGPHPVGSPWVPRLTIPALPGSRGSPRWRRGRCGTGSSRRGVLHPRIVPTGLFRGPHRPRGLRPGSSWHCPRWELGVASGTGPGRPPRVPGSPFPGGVCFRRFVFGAGGSGMGGHGAPEVPRSGELRGEAVLEAELRGHKGSYKTGMF